MRRCVIGLLAMVLVVAACGDDGATDDSLNDEESTTFSTGTTAVASTTEATSVETTQTTAAAVASGPAFIRKGETGAYVWALQTYLDCAGFGPIDIDGVFGDGTAASVELAQTDEGKIPTGEPDEETFVHLSRECSQPREVAFAPGATTSRVAGNAGPGDDEIFQINVVEGQQMTIGVDRGVNVGVTGADGSVLHPADDSSEIVVDIATSQMHEITVSATMPASYSLVVTIPALPEDATTTTSAAATGSGLTMGGLGDAAFGASPDETVAAVEALISDLEVGLYDPEDSGWVAYDEPYCAETARTLTWEIIWPAAVDFWAVDLTVFLYSEEAPTFGGWSLDHQSQGDGDYPDPQSLSTEHGLGIWDTLEEAESYGFQHGGYEELSMGTLDQYMVRIPDAPGYFYDDRVTEIAAGQFMICDPF